MDWHEKILNFIQILKTSGKLQDFNHLNPSRIPAPSISQIFLNLTELESFLHDLIFGMLVHETIEDIHRAALRNESHSINADNIES